MAFTSPRMLRQAIASGEWQAPTAGLLDGYQQANLVVLPREDAAEFLLFCSRNPKACPLLAVSEPGAREIELDGVVIDLCSMFPRYRVWQQGEWIADPLDLHTVWREDSVAFLLGCSHSLDGPLREIGVPVSLAAPPVYMTTLPCQPTQRLKGYVAVSMRPVDADKVEEVLALCTLYPSAHGRPLHIGEPAAIGIADLTQPDFGVWPGIAAGQVPVFWACGVTPQRVVPALQSAYLFTHYPGHMLVLDGTVKAYSERFL